MKILVASDDPFSYSAYSQQGWLVTKYLQSIGHDVKYYGLYYPGKPQIYEGVPLYGNMGQHNGSTLFTHYLKQFESDLLFTIKDPLIFDKGVMKRVSVWAAFCPVDTEPISPGLKSILQTAYRILTPTRWSQSEISALGLSADYTPHAVDLTFWQTPSDRRAFRKRLQIAENAFVACMVGANNEYPSRKGFDIAITAWSIFIKEHPDSVLYIYSDVNSNPGGVSIANLFNMLDIPERNYRVVDQGFFNQGLEREYIRDIYYASDVFLHPSTGEGFSIPVVEAQACGLPVISNNFTALKETVKVGWKLNWEDPTHGDLFFHPWQSFRFRSNTSAVVACLEQAYALYHTDNWVILKEKAKNSILEYDLKVLDQYWKPVFEQIEKDIKAEL